MIDIIDEIKVYTESRRSSKVVLKVTTLLLKGCQGITQVVNRLGR